MFTFTRYVLLFTYFLSTVFTLPLVSRDVVDPPITSPTASTVWTVGQTATVTWSTANLPVNQTNPVGMLVLGYMYNNSENLMLNSPLATGLNYSVGQAQITVPDVPTRTDYIVVLFGDSGNASPQFTIINGSSSSSSAAPPPATTSPAAPSPSATSPSASTPPSSPNSPGSSPVSSPTPETGTPTAVGALPTNTVPSGQSSILESSTTVVVTASASRPSSSSTQSNAAWQKQVPNLGTSLSVALTVLLFAFS